MKNQERLKSVGTSELYCVGEVDVDSFGQCLLYDDFNEEMYYLYEIQEALELYEDGCWQAIQYIGDGKIQLEGRIISVQEGMKMRFLRKFLYAYELLIEELSDGSFFAFMQGLKKIGFSLHHCIYCHNFLLFQPSQDATGVNFLVFDNKDLVCQIQHHYKRIDGLCSDRFVFTLSTGEHLMTEYIEG